MKNKLKRILMAIAIILSFCIAPILVIIKMGWSVSKEWEIYINKTIDEDLQRKDPK